MATIHFRVVDTCAHHFHLKFAQQSFAFEARGDGPIQSKRGVCYLESTHFMFFFLPASAQTVLFNTHFLFIYLFLVGLSSMITVISRIAKEITFFHDAIMHLIHFRVNRSLNEKPEIGTFLSFRRRTRYNLFLHHSTYEIDAVQWIFLIHSSISISIKSMNLFIVLICAM